MKYNSVAEIREMYSLLVSQLVEHENAIKTLGSDYPSSVSVLEDKISDINILLDDLDDQEELITGVPAWIRVGKELAEQKIQRGVA